MKIYYDCFIYIITLFKSYIGPIRWTLLFWLYFRYRPREAALPKVPQLRRGRTMIQLRQPDSLALLTISYNLSLPSPTPSTQIQYFYSDDLEGETRLSSLVREVFRVVFNQGLRVERSSHANIWGQWSKIHLFRYPFSPVCRWCAKLFPGPIQASRQSLVFWIFLPCRWLTQLKKNMYCLWWWEEI